jgi:hypothetical protein
LSLVQMTEPSVCGMRGAGRWCLVHLKGTLTWSHRLHSHLTALTLSLAHGTAPSVCGIPAMLMHWSVCSICSSQLVSCPHTFGLVFLPAQFSDSVEWQMNDKGWVVDKQSRLLVWVPSHLRPSLMQTRTALLISTHGYLHLNFTNTLTGESWMRCYLPE